MTPSAVAATLSKMTRRKIGGAITASDFVNVSSHSRGSFRSLGMSSKSWDLQHCAPVLRPVLGKSPDELSQLISPSLTIRFVASTWCLRVLVVSVIGHVLESLLFFAFIL